MAGHPSIAQVAVIGFPDEVQGEEICAVVVRAPEGEDLDADPLIAWCKERLGGHNPRRIEFLAALPLGPSGKIPNANWSRTCSPTAGGGAGLVAGSSIPTRAPSPPRASPRRRPHCARSDRMIKIPHYSRQTPHERKSCTPLPSRTLQRRANPHPRMPEQGMS